MSNYNPLVAEYVSLDLRIKALEAERDIIRKQLIELAEPQFVPGKSVKLFGDNSEVSLSRSYANRFSQHLAQTLLSDEDFKRCFAVDINPTYRATGKLLASA
jgi:hypothetical protein